MSSVDDFEEDAARRSYGRPYTSKHPVPTIQGYRERQAELKAQTRDAEPTQNQQDGEDSKLHRAYDSVKSIAKGEDRPVSAHDSYPTANRNFQDRPQRDDTDQNPLHDATAEKEFGKGDSNSKSQEKSATETAAGHVDPKEKRHAMKKMKRTGGGREVTDPVTHLPIVIHDQTDNDLKGAPENEPASGTNPRSFTGLSGASKSRSQLDQERSELQSGHEGMKMMFPPPAFDETKNEMTRVYKLAMAFGLGSIVIIATLALIIIQLLNGFSYTKTPDNSSWSGEKSGPRRPLSVWIGSLIVIVLAGGAGVVLTGAVSGWISNRVGDIFEDETWDAARQEEIQMNNSEAELPESVAWLNGVLASVWPLVNPDLFASVVDTLEDVMQASLPKIVRMVSVDDVGQGNEAVRILGVRWLPTGAASQSVDGEGNLQKPDDSKSNDRTVPGGGEIEDNENDESGVSEKPKANKDSEQQRQERKQEEQAIREGMEAEEGDFVNMELAFAYRARSSGKSLKTKAKNAHLYLKFYLPGGIAIPVWVELKGIIGTMRLRLQLTPDPPFFSLCTMTFLGQPRADLSCVPLSKHNLNLMDVPLLSSFVQSSIDAALAEYVAPKSLTLDLKDMLMGDDFKKDTVTRGVVILYIKRARGFKEGDGGIGPFRGASDAYVTVSWGKFGKPAASTRVIVDTQEPDWNEWASILVSPDELNAEEKLRVQLWDSDKHTADDDLGRVEVNLKDLMYSSKTQNQMCDREDDLKAEDPDEKMPGTLTWSVGYFAKAHIQPNQLEQQTVDPKIRTKEQLKDAVSKTASRKLREATYKDESKELHQQRVQDYKEQEDLMIISTPPPDDLRSGIFSIQIHNITGLEVQHLNRTSKGEQAEDREDEADLSDSIPDSYATIILNHRKIYRTRTKPKNAKPFFNAGTERFVSDWKSAEVMISVRDSREREDDPLLGLVYLPLRKVFEKTSQVMSTYPLAGGIGYGKARISMIWRSVELKLPKELLGWEYGTLEVKVPVRIKDGGSMTDELQQCRIKLRTNLGRVKMHHAESHTFHSGHHSGEKGREWTVKGKQANESAFLAVRKRYASCLLVEFRKSTIGPDSTPAFAAIWLSDLVDEEEQSVTAKIWKGGKENIKRAESCCDYKGLKENEQPVGEIEMTLKFWRGLGGYHKSYAQKSRNGDVRDVMEALDTINDEKMDEDDEYEHDRSDSDSDSTFDDPDSVHRRNDNTTRQKTASPEDSETKRKLKTHANQDISDGAYDSDSGVSALKRPAGTIKKKMNGLLHGGSDHEDDGKRGLRGQLQDYQAHHRQLHRKHRGVMQWKSVRTLDWMMGKAKRGKGMVEGAFEHSEKGQGIETEV